MSFRCEHCGAQNNEIQSAETIRRMQNFVALFVFTRADFTI